MSEQLTQLLELTATLNNRCSDYRDTIAKQQAIISNSIGYQYPSRAIIEYALKTQTGSSIDILKASKDFFERVI